MKKVKVKIGDEVELWNQSKGKVTDMNPVTCKFELTPNGGFSGWFHIMDIRFLNGEYVDDAGELEFEKPEKETLTEKYSRLIIEGNEDLSLDQFIFTHDGSHFFVKWYNGKWSDPKPIKILS